jgi:hypothetical protein
MPKGKKRKSSNKKKSTQKKQKSCKLPPSLSTSLSSYSPPQSSSSSSDLKIRLTPQEPTYKNLMDFLTYIIYTEVIHYDKNDITTQQIILLYVVIFPLFLPSNISEEVFITNVMSIYKYAKEQNGKHSNFHDIKQNYKISMNIFKNYARYKKNNNSKYLPQNYNQIWHTLPYGLSHRHFCQKIMMMHFRDVYIFNFNNISQMSYFIQKKCISREVFKLYKDYKNITDVCCTPKYLTYEQVLQFYDQIASSSYIPDYVVTESFPYLYQNNYKNHIENDRDFIELCQDIAINGF